MLLRLRYCRLRHAITPLARHVLLCRYDAMLLFCRFIEYRYFFRHVCFT